MAQRRGGKFGGKIKPFGGRGDDTTTTSSTIHPKILKQARQSGQLNLSGRSLEIVPDCVWKINQDLPEEAKSVSLDNSDDRWWEQTDLTKLILASNILTGISEDISLLPALTVLDIHDNRLVSLPKSIQELTQLQRVNLSHNKLELLPSELCRLPNLTVLQLQHNSLTQLCDEIGDLTSLEELDLSNNLLSDLTPNIGYLTKLRKLNLAQNKIASIPVEMGDLRCLRMLEFTHNQLRSLPAELGNLSQLEQLYLRHNQLSSIPSLPNCSNLKELHLGNNQLREVSPSTLNQLTSVSVLDLRDNKIGVLPDEIIHLEGLERLDLTNNDLAGLPYCLGNLQKLKSVVLDGNPMKSIRRDIIMRGTNELKKYLQSRIEEPAEDKQDVVNGNSGRSTGIIGDHSALDLHTVNQFKTVDFSNKGVSEVPDEVWEAAVKAGVLSINLNKNNITQLPPKLMVVVDSLKELYLGFNKLQTVNPDIGLYLKLTTLDFRNNRLDSLPSEMSSLQNLRELTISNNRFSSLPDVIYSLEKLEILFAADNKITDIHVPGLMQLKALGTLDLQNNDIGKVPPELGNCSWIKSLQLGGNAFRNPRPAILDKGTLALLEYLRGRIVS